MQLNIERTKPSLGSYTELPPGLRSKTKATLNIRNNKLNCLQLCITAALFPAADHATRESRYINNLVDDWEDNENNGVTWAGPHNTKVQILEMFKLRQRSQGCKNTGMG